VSSYLPSHLASGVRRYRSIALRLGGAFEYFGLPLSSFVAENETLQQASTHKCSSGWDRGHLLPLSLLLPYFLVSQMLAVAPAEVNVNFES
jgi:hypothetical protein